MAGSTAIVDLSAVFEDHDLRATSLLLDLANNFGSFDVRGADFQAVTIEQKDLIEDDFIAFLAFDFLDKNRLADLDADLFSAGFDNCEHIVPPI